MLAIAAVFYLFFIRPQQQRAKKEKQFREGLKKGDSVKTIGGLYGKIEKIDEASVLLKVDDNTRLRFDKEAVRPVDDNATTNTKSTKKEKEKEVASNKDSAA